MRLELRPAALAPASSSPGAPALRPDAGPARDAAAEAASAAQARAGARSPAPARGSAAATTPSTPLEVGEKADGARLHHLLRQDPASPGTRAAPVPSAQSEPLHALSSTGRERRRRRAELPRPVRRGRSRARFSDRARRVPGRCPAGPTRGAGAQPNGLGGRQVVSPDTRHLAGGNQVPDGLRANAGDPRDFVRNRTRPERLCWSLCIQGSSNEAQMSCRPLARRHARFAPLFGQSRPPPAVRRSRAVINQRQPPPKRGQHVARAPSTSPVAPSTWHVAT